MRSSIVLLVLAASTQGAAPEERYASFTWGAVHPTRGLAADGTHLFATTKEGLKIIPKASFTGQPAAAAGLALKGIPERLALIDAGRVAVGTGLHVAIADVSDRAAPKLLAELRVAHEELFGCADLAARGTTLYVAARRQGLLTVDVSSPAEPNILRRLELPGMATGIAIDGGIACVAVGSGVAFVDIQAKRPKKLSYLDTLRSAWCIAAAGRRAVIGATNYIEVIDFSIPTRPKSVREGTGRAPFWYQGNRGLQMQGRLVYAAAAEGGLCVYDWASGPRTRLLGQFGFWKSGATRQSRLEYVKKFGIARTDDEAARFIPETFNQYLFAVALAVDGPHAFVLSHDGQIRCFRFTQKPHPAIELLSARK